MVTVLCFPEPSVEDPTPARWGERTGAWLARSTWVRARECRQFYNTNLVHLPAEAAASLCTKLKREPSQAAHFELVVGRFLQLIGATTVEYEVRGTEGRSIDWTAHFTDGVASVEATAPVVNNGVAAETKAARPVIEALLAVAPRGWHPLVFHAPPLAPSEPLRWLRRRLAEMVATMPARKPGLRHEMELRLENGLLEVVFVGASDPDLAPSEVTGPAVGYIDNTSTVVEAAVAGKRRQARGAQQPVLAALYTGGFGSHEVEKFDIALFGRTVAHLGSQEVALDPSGVFGRGRGEPTFAGVLAFAGLGWTGGPDPILYVHPRYTGRLPEALSALRRRLLTPTAIENVPARREGILGKMGWPTLARE